MKIAVDVRPLLGQEPSGVGEYTLNLLKKIFEQDTVNSYVLFYNVYKPGYDKLILENFANKYHNVTIKATHWPNKIFNFSLRFLRYPKLDKLAGGVDLFFIPNLHYLALSKKCLRIITVHDLSFHLFPDMFSYKKRLWHSRLVINAKKLFIQADHLLAVSENTKLDLIKSYNIPAEKITVTHLAVADQFLAFQEKILEQSTAEKIIAVKQKYNLPHDFILTLSTLEPRKNICSLIRAYNILKSSDQNKYKQLELVIAGGQGWCYGDIYQAAKKSPYSQQIKFLGYVEGASKPYLYHLARVFVWPSFYEGFGLPPLEAMASGTPVIASAVSSLPEVVGRAAVLINPFDTGEIVVALEQVLNSKELKQVLVAEGFSQVNKFSWGLTARKTLEIINYLT